MASLSPVVTSWQKSKMVALAVEILDQNSDGAHHGLSLLAEIRNEGMSDLAASKFACNALNNMLRGAEPDTMLFKVCAPEPAFNDVTMLGFPDDGVTGAARFYDAEIYNRMVSAAQKLPTWADRMLPRTNEDQEASVEHFPQFKTAYLILKKGGLPLSDYSAEMVMSVVGDYGPSCLDATWQEWAARGLPIRT